MVCLSCVSGELFDRGGFMKYIVGMVFNYKQIRREVYNVYK